MKNKRGTWIMWASISFIVVLVLCIFLYFALYHPNYEEKYTDKIGSGELVNPITGLSTDQAVSQFNESFVYYILFSIKAYNLHNPALSSDTPKIEFFIGNDVYGAEISDGEISVTRGEISEKDIVIRTTREEAVKMLQDSMYIKKSFSAERSQIDLIAGKATLFGKGYLNIYTELTGNGITGSVVRIYVD
jgi:hypothetical protein